MRNEVAWKASNLLNKNKTDNIGGVGTSRIKDSQKLILGR